MVARCGAKPQDLEAADVIDVARGRGLDYSSIIDTTGGGREEHFQRAGAR
jgi:hypothetical protein